MELLRKRFLHFSDKNARKKFSENRQASMAILDYLLKDENEFALMQQLGSIFDEICLVKGDEKNEKTKEEKIVVFWFTIINRFAYLFRKNSWTIEQLNAEV